MSSNIILGLITTEMLNSDLVYGLMIKIISKF